jgi:sodium/bile acid cotransporter 7
MNTNSKPAKPNGLRTFFKRIWFLALLVVMVGACVLWPEPGNYLYRKIGPTPFIFILLVLTGMTLPVTELRRGFDSFRPVAVALSTNYVFLPLLFWFGGACVFGPTHPFTIALIVMGAAPTSLSSSSVWTNLAGGNTGRAVALTVLSHGLNFVACPLILCALLGKVLTLPFGEMVLRLAWSVLLPLFIGQAAAWVLRKVGWDVAGRRRLIGVVSQCLVLTILALAAAFGAMQASAVTGKLVALLILTCFLVHGFAVSAATGAGKLLRLERADLIAVIFVGGQKTLPVSIYVLSKFFPEQADGVMALVAYHIMQLMFDSVLIEWFRRKSGGQ